MKIKARKGGSPPRLVTVAALSVQLQQPFGRVQEILRTIGAEPAIYLNGTPHYSEDVFERCRQWLSAKDSRPSIADGRGT
jgi:hypothetical protein